MSSETTQAYSNDYQLSTAAPDALVQEIDDIRQCIETILNTQLGTDPMRPNFGTNYRNHIDGPNNVAPARMINDIIDAVTRWEDRITITNVTYLVKAEQTFYEISWSSRYGNGVNVLVL